MSLQVCASLIISVFLALFSGHGVALAASDDIVRIEPLIRDGQLYIDADVNLEISDELRTAAERGIPLYFVAEVKIVSPRWWWFDKVVVDKRQTWRILYNVLTQEWRVGTGELSLSEPSLDDALAFVRNIRGWSVTPANELEPDVEYEGRLRVRLDSTRLPRPFQVDSYNSKAWSLSTPWKNFTFLISEPAPTSS